jgi:hypothetical protein
MRGCNAVMCVVYIGGVVGCAPGGTVSRGHEDPPGSRDTDGARRDGGALATPDALSAYAAVDSIALLQPVEIPLVEGGASVAPDVPIYADRDTMVRVGVRLAGGPQTIRAVVEVDGAVFTDTRSIARTSVPDDQASNLWVRVPASAVRERSILRVRLEGEGDAAIDVRGAHEARWPADGSTAPLGAVTSGALRLVLVRMHHTPSGDAGLARITPAQVERFRQVFAAAYPISHGQLTVELRAEPIQTSGTAAVVGDTVPFIDRALEDLNAAWDADAVSPNTIYIGLLDWDEVRFPCDGQCGSGVANGWTLADLGAGLPMAGVVGAWADAAETPWMPDYVAGWIEYNGLPPEAIEFVPDETDVAIYQAVHEASHTLTLGHAPCGNFDPDPAYPVSNGQLDTWAYDSAEDIVRPPDMHFDVMTYCGPPEFVSRFTYLKLDAAIRALQR